MATMSTYELKVTGMLKESASEAQVEAAEKAFREIFEPKPPTGSGKWQDDFVLKDETELEKDTTVEDASWELMKGSKLKDGSTLAPGSILNDSTVFDTPIKDTEVTARTVVLRGTLLTKGTKLKDTAYTAGIWEVNREATPEWAGDGTEKGTYLLLSFLGLVGVVRKGALGQHWDKQTAQDELKWFYKYKKEKWFKELIKALKKFNNDWGEHGKDVLEEEARIRDLKWYCGNGGGP
jgi:hypothetical protein